jgi:hypothetical protein
MPLSQIVTDPVFNSQSPHPHLYLLDSVLWNIKEECNVSMIRELWRIALCDHVVRFERIARQDLAWVVV